ncbi:MAG: hypothetical protein ABW088_05315 [Sedimenticola sp.]
MEEQSGFFARSQSITALTGFKGRMNTLHTEDEFELARNGHIQTIIQSMANRPGQWDELCEINISWIGDHFISRISDGGEDLSKEKLDDIFSMCFRFLFELYLSMKNDLAPEFERARSFAFEQIEEFEQNAKSQIEYTIRDMPINIFKSIANSESIQSIKNFNEVSRSAIDLREEWENDLAEKEARVLSLKESLNKYESGFNFVGLFDGFNDLSNEKTTEKNNLLFWLRVLGVLIVSPLVVEVIVIYLNLDNLDNIKIPLALSTIPTISLVVIFIYYFRVLLFNYKSVKSQLLQIELRKTLCRFIQHYTEYSSEIKKKDGDSLEKFENIIFSGIVSDDEKLPSTFDGVEQISKLIKAAKS